MEKTNIDPNSLQREEWNSLVVNYDKHDIAEAYFKGRIEQIGLQTEHWGIDMRYDDSGLIFDNKMDLRLWEPLDGQSPPSVWPSDVAETATDDAVSPPSSWTINVSDEVRTYSENSHSDERWDLRGIVDIKSKTSESWLGIFNLRHYVHYAEWARKYDVPAFVYFTIVDMDAEAVGEQNILVPIEPFDNLDDYIDHYDRDSSYEHTTVDITDDSEIIQSTWMANDGNYVVKIDSEYWNNFDYLVSEIL
jgi:hypothetical protein